MSAAFSHLGVRYAKGVGRLALFGLALGFMIAAFGIGRALGGFWSGVYALLSAYFLACMVMPLLDLAIRYGGDLVTSGEGKSSAR